MHKETYLPIPNEIVNIIQLTDNQKGKLLNGIQNRAQNYRKRKEEIQQSIFIQYCKMIDDYWFQLNINPNYKYININSRFKMAMFIRFAGAIRMGFFWKKKAPKKSDIQQMIDAVKVAPNIGYMVQSLKTNNLNKMKLLPPQKREHQGKLTVVMELDEVLSYTFTPNQEGYLQSPLRKHDIYHEFDEYDACLSIFKRKNLQNFINYVSEQCEPVLWSTGVPSYVQLMLSYLDPHKKIPYVFDQRSCDLLQNKQQQIDIFVKDLNLLGRDLSRVVYLDSKPMSYWLYPENCLPMQQYRADMTMENEDLNLYILQLQNLKQYKDVRVSLNERFGIREILKDAKMI